MQKKYYSLSEKLRILSTTNQRLEQGESLRSIAESFGVQGNQLRRWQQKRNQFIRTKKTRKALTTGRVSCLKHLEAELIQWFLDLREAGVAINYRALCIKAARLDPDFAGKPFSHQYQSMRRFCKANAISIRAATHVAQARAQETHDQALDFIRTMRPLLTRPVNQQRFILNMDQTAVFFCMLPKKTLNLSGADSVLLSTLCGTNHRVTVSVTVTADGDILKPMVIFKGRPAGRIARRELPALQENSNGVLICQDNAWMDETGMMEWIRQILVPYLQEKGDGIIPVLILDSYKVHTMNSVERRLQEVGVECYFIPGGCTSVAQPIDVGVGKPFKDRLREKWMDWAIELGEDIVDYPPPSRAQVVGWIDSSLAEITNESVRNSWRKGGMSYFPNVE